MCIHTCIYIPVPPFSCPLVQEVVVFSFELRDCFSERRQRHPTRVSLLSSVSTFLGSSPHPVVSLSTVPPSLPLPTTRQEPAYREPAMRRHRHSLTVLCRQGRSQSACRRMSEPAARRGQWDTSGILKTKPESCLYSHAKVGLTPAT